MLYPFQRTALALPLAIAVAASAHAQQRDDRQRPDRTNRQQQQQQQQQTRQQARTDRNERGAAFNSQLIHANQLIGMDVQNRQGEDLGQIEEIILDDTHDRVQYVVLSFGGWLNVGDKLFAVPFNAFQFRAARDQDEQRGVGIGEEQGIAILDVSRERLKNAPGFDPDQYPDVANPEFAQDVERFYGQGEERQRQYSQQPDRQTRTRTDRDRRQQARDRDDLDADWDWDLQGEEQEHWSQDWQKWQLRALTRVIGSDIEDPQEWNIGDIEDVIIDRREGRLAYAIISYGGLLGKVSGHAVTSVQEKQAVIPWGALRPQPQDGQYTLNIPRERAEEALDAVAYDEESDLTDDQFAQRVHREFNTDPYWEIYGYSRVRVDPSVGWRADADFVQKYDADEARRIEGRVQSIGTFYPQSNSAPGLRLRVRTDEGRTVTVLGGPQAFARQQGVNFYNGDQVTITAARATVDGRQVYIAREIRSGDQTLRLFNEQGRPLWNAEDLLDEYSRHYLYHGVYEMDQDSGVYEQRRDRSDSDAEFRSDSRSRYESDRDRRTRDQRRDDRSRQDRYEE